MKKVFEYINKTIKGTSQDVTKIMTETFKEKIKTLLNLNDKLLNIMNDRGILVSYLMSPLSKITSLAHTSQSTLRRIPDSNRVSDLLINKTIPITVNDNLLKFRDTDKNCELEEDLMKMTTNKNYNVDLAKLTDKKSMLDFDREISFDEKALRNKNNRDKTLNKLLESTAVMASGISTIFFRENPNELCGDLKLLPQTKTSWK